MRKILLLLGLILASQWAQSQLRKNEKLVYVASYNLSGLLTKFAEVNLETEPVKTAKNEYLHFSMQVATYSKWDSFFKMRDIYECYVHPYTLKPSLFFKTINEGSYSQNQKYVFNHTKNTVVCTSKINKKDEIVTTRNIHPATQDIISNLFKIRVLNYTGYPTGKIFYLKLLFDEREYTVYIKYLGIENTSAGCLGKRECIKIAVSGNMESINKNKANVVWITNDERRIPALIKFNVKVGTGQLTLAKMS